MEYNISNGQQQMASKRKMSISTLIALVITVILAIAMIGSLLYLSIVSSNLELSSQQVAGWLIAIIIGVSIIIIPYYLILFTIGFILDKRYKKSKTFKEFIMFFFLIVPVLYVFNLYLEKTQRSFTFGDVSVSFSSEFVLTSYIENYDGDYTSVTFFSETDGKNACMITFAIYDYDGSKDLISNFKNNCNRFTFVDKKLTLYDVYDSVTYLKKEKINGKNWDYYENEFSNISYKMYGLVSEKSFYKIEIIDKTVNDSVCNEKVQEFLKTVQYK